MIVRSLKAGHPVPVAIGLVARELPDPIGTEFGLVADEVTYGSDLVTALRKMQGRVGQEDLPLFITAVSIQSSTGGNLREILQGLSDVIRQRIKMRRKIQSISAEGRISAYFLTALLVPHWDNLRKALAAVGAGSVSDGGKSEEELARSPAVQEFFRKRVALRLADVAGYEQVKKFIVLPRPFTVAADELTVSLKTRRNVIFAKHQAALDALYRE